MAERHVTSSRQDRMLRQWVELWERNRLQIIGVLALIVIALGGWGGSVYYQNYREAKAVSLFAALPEDAQLRREGLESLVANYPKTGTGIYAAFELGRTDYEKGNYDQALRWYEPLTRLSGEQAMIGIMSQNNVAMIYEAQGEWAEALEVYRQTAADPHNVAKADAYYNMGRVSQNLGDSEEARRWFQKALELGTGLPVAERARDRLLWLNIGSQ